MLASKLLQYQTYIHEATDNSGGIIAYLYHELDRRLASLTILSRRRGAETYPDVREIRGTIAQNFDDLSVLLNPLEKWFDPREVLCRLSLPLRTIDLSHSLPDIFKLR